MLTPAPVPTGLWGLAQQAAWAVPCGHCPAYTANPRQPDATAPLDVLCYVPATLVRAAALAPLPGWLARLAAVTPLPLGFAASEPPDRAFLGL